LDAFYNGEFPAGQALVMDASRDGVALPMETSKFSTFSQADYDAIYAKLVAGEVPLLKDSDVKSVIEIPVENVTITEIQ
ncbi:MAG: BMP family ABC transporter substrate-binding protein, partial [Eubacteriales bacterium]|nr:BMP family ABC transporter substrate-binding protein [Eubacteriales bacterium]